MNNKKLQLFAAAAAFSLLATQGAFAQKKYDTGASDTEIKIGNVEAYSGPGVRLRHHRQDRGSLFQDDQRPGRHQRPQDQLDLL